MPGRTTRAEPAIAAIDHARGYQILVDIADDNADARHQTCWQRRSFLAIKKMKGPLRCG